MNITMLIATNRVTVKFVRNEKFGGTKHMNMCMRFIKFDMNIIVVRNEVKMGPKEARG